MSYLVTLAYNFNPGSLKVSRTTEFCPKHRRGAPILYNPFDFLGGETARTSGRATGPNGFCKMQTSSSALWKPRVLGPQKDLEMRTPPGHTYLDSKERLAVVEAAQGCRQGMESVAFFRHLVFGPRHHAPSFKFNGRAHRMVDPQSRSAAPVHSQQPRE